MCEYIWSNLTFLSLHLFLQGDCKSNIPNLWIFTLGIWWKQWSKGYLLGTLTQHWNFQNNHPMNNVIFKLFTLNFEKIIIYSHITLENYWAAIWLAAFCKRLKLWPHYNFKVMELIIKKLIILWSCTFLNSFLFPFFFFAFSYLKFSNLFYYSRIW